MPPRARLKLDFTDDVVIDAALNAIEAAMPALDLPRAEAEAKLPGLQSALRYLLAFDDEPDTVTEGKVIPEGENHDPARSRSPAADRHRRR